MLLRRAGSSGAPGAGPWRGRDATASPRGRPPEVRRFARTAGTTLALASLLLAFTAGAHGADRAPSAGGGALAWVFALFVGAAVIGVFLVVRHLVEPPLVRHPGARPPGSARER
jgi:hypothetical protein